MTRSDDALLAEADCGIRQLYARCVDAVWRRDFAGFGDCFTKDGEWSILNFHFRGREQIGKGLEQLSRDNVRVLMMPGIPVLHPRAGGFSGRTSLTELVKCRDGRGAVTLGTYYEDYVHRGDGWLFQSRHFEMHYFGAMDLSAGLLPTTDYGPPPGMPDLDDPTLKPDP